MTPRRVTIVEVGPRDGLQNETAAISTADKVAFVNLLSRAGLPVIEVTAFVSPKWVPQMADAADVFARIDRGAGDRYTALVPNLAGLERAHAAGVTEVAIFAAASETFSRRNINQSIDESLNTYRAVCAGRRRSGMRVRAYLSDGLRLSVRGRRRSRRGSPTLSAALIEMGAFEVAVSDTIGIAHPGQVPVVVEAVAARVPARTDRPALPRHARHGARQRSGRAAARRHHVRRVVRRARRLSLCARAPPAISPPRTSSTCSTAWGSRPASTRGAGRGVALHRAARRPCAAVAVLQGRAKYAPPAKAGYDAYIAPRLRQQSLEPRMKAGRLQQAPVTCAFPHPLLQPLVAPAVDHPLGRNAGDARVGDRVVGEAQLADRVRVAVEREEAARLERLARELVVERPAGASCRRSRSRRRALRPSRTRAASRR